jgi:hypothetical protein
MRMRILVVLATFAALLGAPSIASGAGSSLGSPSVSPTNGSVTTLFTMRVTYDGEFPAIAVTVAVAGLHLPLVLISGSAEQGTWSASSILPAGTWTPTFSAVPLQGNSDTVSGAIISVVGAPTIGATPAPTVTTPMPTRVNEPDSEVPLGSEDPGTGVDPAPADDLGGASPSADAEPVGSTPASPPGAGQVGASSGAEPVRSEGSTSSPAAAGGRAGAAGGGGGDAPAAASGGTAGATGGGGGDAPAAPAEDDPRQRSAEPGGMPAAGRAGAGESEGIPSDPLLGVVLLIGLSGVAVVALIGGIVLSIGRRRPDDGEDPTSAARARATEAVLERRTLRQAKVRLDDDPIVAAMGVEDQVAARRRRSAARQVASGPGERPVRRRR